MQLNNVENQILAMLIRGKTNLEIANKIGFSESNVKKIVKKLFSFYNVRKRVDLVRECMKCSGCCKF